MKKKNLILSLATVGLAAPSIMPAISCASSTSTHNVSLAKNLFSINSYLRDFTLEFKFEDKFKISENSFSCPSIEFNKVKIITEDETKVVDAKEIFKIKNINLKNNSNIFTVEMSFLNGPDGGRISLGDIIYASIKINWVEGTKTDASKILWSKDFDVVTYYEKQIKDSIDRKVITDQKGEVFIYNLEFEQPVPEGAFFDISVPLPKIVPEERYDIRVLHNVLAEDRKSIKLYILDYNAANPDKRANWFDLKLACKIQTSPTTVNRLWSQDIDYVHIDYEMPETQVTTEGLRFPAGSSEYYTHVTFTNPKITGSGIVKPTPIFWTGVDFSRIVSVTFDSEQFTEAGKTTFKMNIKFEAKVETPVVIDPYIGVEIKVDDETFIKAFYLIFM